MGNLYKKSKKDLNFLKNTLNRKMSK